jgi:hypothetical protein
VSVLTRGILRSKRRLLLAAHFKPMAWAFGTGR